MKVEATPGFDALSAPPIAEECNHRDCDEQVRRILDSPLFSSSRRLSDFLLFAANAAKEGRTEVDQYEVAEQVLHRNGDFNPLDDASVRKLASQVRHKLEEYYRTDGANDGVVVSLPRRSYVLRFRPPAVSPAVEPSLPSGAGDRGTSSSDNLAAPGTVAAEGAGCGTTDNSTSMDALHPGSTPDHPHLDGDGAVSEPRAEQQTPDVYVTDAATRSSAKTWMLYAAGAVLCLLLGYGLGVFRGDKPISEIAVGLPDLAYPISIRTQKGDLRGPGSDIQRGAVLAAPVLGGNGDVTVRMQFLPQHATQQAGLLLIRDEDNFLRLGSHFKIRSMVEMGYEEGGKYAMRQSAYQYDPLGQSGLPMWLSLRRYGDVFQGYISRDGAKWEQYGPEQQFHAGDTNLLGGVYAFNGRTDIPSTTALFSTPSSGLRFHNRPNGPLQMEDFPGWHVSSDCADQALATISGQALEVHLPSDQLCAYSLRHNLTKPVSRNWSFTVYLDFLSSSGSSAGLSVVGAKSTLRLVRRDLNGGSIMLERNVDRDMSVTDFPGTPPVFLRLAAKDGVIRGSFSRDGMHFEPIPGEIQEAEIGGSVTAFGGEMTLSHWLQPGPRPPARFLAIEQDLIELQPMRQ